MSNKENRPDCDEVRELINEYIDGELDDGTAASVAAHIEVCPDCRRLYESLTSADTAVAALSDDVPDTLHEKIMSAVGCAQKADRRAARIRRFTGFVGVGVAAMLCVGVGIFAINKKMQSDTPYNGADINQGSLIVAYSCSSVDQDDLPDGGAELEYSTTGKKNQGSKDAADEILMPTEERYDEAADCTEKASPCEDSPSAEDAEKKGASSEMPFYVGEWSLSTDGGEKKLTLDADGSFSFGELNGKYVPDGKSKLKFTAKNRSVSSTSSYYVEKTDGGIILTYISGEELF